MKKYHLMEIYQVPKKVGYLKSGERYFPFTFIGKIGIDYKIYTEPTIVNTKKIIMVEKKLPFLVREVKTGIVFPIVNFKPILDYQTISCFHKKVHTFVCSENNILFSLEVTTSEQIEQYNKMYPDSKKLKEELETIINTGKNNMDARIAREMYNNQQKIQKTKIEQDSKRFEKTQEKMRIRSLKRQFRQERRKV